MPSIDALDDRVLDECYDPGSLARGRRYAAEDRVQLLGTEPGLVNAVCRGSGRNTYVVGLRWSDRGDRIDLHDTCSCPLGGACKHCVATLLTARRQAARHGTSEASHAGSQWRRALADLAIDDTDDDAPRAHVALEFAVHDPPRTRYAPDTDPVVTIRPLRRGKSGKWLKTGASWRDVDSPYSQNLADVDPRQRAALRGLVSSGRLDRYYGSSQAVSLHQFGPDLWYQLARAMDAGVAFVGEQDGRVALSEVAARATIDLTQDGSGAVTLTTGFVLDGEPFDVVDGRGGLVGRPAHGLWLVRAPTLHLVPFDTPLHPTVARLATSDALTVPAPDVDELLDEFQPAMARHAVVHSSDGSVTITTSRFDRIVLHIERTALDAAVVHWSARYRRGERTVDRRLLAPGGSSRDVTAESAAIAALELPTHLLPGLAGADGTPRDLRVSGEALITLLTDVVSWLDAKSDVTVEITGSHPTLRAARADPLVELAVTDGLERAAKHDGNDWFDLDVSVSVDGETVDFVMLFGALHRGDDVLILPSGTWMRLDVPRLTKLRDLIDEARGLAEPTSDSVARVNRFQASWWQELTELGVVSEQSRRWAESILRLGALTAPEAVPPPVGLEATLRHYQQDGLDWLAFLHRNRLGGILADDMGLGKTVQTLALCLHVHDADPNAKFLVVAPTSVVENWTHEAARFAPGLRVTAIRETATRRGTSLDDEIAGADVVVTSYALFRIEHEQYARHDWELLVLDEAQFVKNHQSKTYQCVRRIEVATKIAVTGTPLENSLMDLWSLLSITAPGLYPDPKRFGDTYRRPIESGEAPELLTVLKRRIAPLMRRRTKDAVLTELPPKTEQTVEVELGARHARIYATQLQRQRQKVLGLVGDVQQHRFEILKSLTILRQLALDPALVDDAHDGVGSAKLDRLLDDLTQVVAEGHRALVFSQFTRYLARVRARLDAAGIAHSYLDGRTRKRDAAISRFKDGDAPVFVISLKAGGFGLNLTEADYCFILDPWWNPATETQAVDRTHRIGQQNPVVVYRYVSSGTIEEKVMELKARKAELFASVMDAEGGALDGALTEDDIRGLLDLG
jgi:superfamily II DNA or RNA helicase